VLTTKPLSPTNWSSEYSESSLNHDLRIAYWSCHIGSTLDGSVRRRRLSALSEMYCVVPAGQITLVFGSASNEYRQVFGSSTVLKQQSQSTSFGGLLPSGVETSTMVGPTLIPLAARASDKNVDRNCKRCCCSNLYFCIACIAFLFSNNALSLMNDVVDDDDDDDVVDDDDGSMEEEDSGDVLGKEGLLLFMEDDNDEDLEDREPPLLIASGERTWGRSMVDDEMSVRVEH